MRGTSLLDSRHKGLAEAFVTCMGGETKWS